MLTYFFIAIVIAAVICALYQMRDDRRTGGLLGADPPGPEVGLFLDTSGSFDHDASTHGACDNGGHGAGGFDCGSHGGFDGGAGHH
jgi:hypothetical protein